jgi:hypothetical protein
MEGNTTKTKDIGDPPNMEELTELLRERFGVLELDSEQRQYYKTPSLKELAEHLGVTLEQMKAAWKKCKGPEGGFDEEALKDKKWGAGRPCQRSELNEFHLDWIVSERTLRQQAGYSFAEKAAAFNAMFSTSVTGPVIREVYEGRGITLQKMKAYTGPPYPSPWEVQMPLIVGL